MDVKHFDFSIKADTDGGRRIEGYGSIFGNVDRGGDVVLPGAFAKSIADGRKVRMLYQHDRDKVIGVWTSVSEDEKGLRVEGELADTPRGNEIYSLLKMNAIEGLSIGYRVTDEEWKDGVRIIREAELWEVSVVSFPMNESATVDAVKASEMSKREFEIKLRDAGFSRTVAKQLLSGGYDAVCIKRDADGDEETRTVIELLNARAKL